MKVTKRILIVEDDPKVTKVMSIRLRSAGYLVMAAENGVRGLQLAEDESPDLIITDLWMSRGAGLPWPIASNNWRSGYRLSS
jgi:DNA-binding response OmpR family regulator